MQRQIEVSGRQVQVEVSRRACKLLQQRMTPLRVDMELNFGRMVRKRVNFNEQATAENLLDLSDNLKVNFCPVMGKSSSVDGCLPLLETPLRKLKAFVPRWLRIDYHHGQWRGEFGYDLD